MSVNKVILVGNVGKDPEVRYLDNNVAVASFSLATTERGYTTRDGQTIPDRTEWHNISVWRGLAQVVEKYVKKGAQLYIEGKIRTRSYEDKDGIKRYVTDITADNLQLLGKRSSGADSETNVNVGNSEAEQSPNSAQSTPSPTSDSANPSTEDETDDLPF